MYQLIYVSQAARPMSEAELAAILRKSRSSNARDGISGLLIYRFSPDEKRGNFMQLLEGDRANVLTAFDRIAADKRHHTKIVLQEGPVERRTFPDWTMGYRNVATAELSAFEGYTDLGSDAFWTRARNGQLNDPLVVLRSFHDDD